MSDVSISDLADVNPPLPRHVKDTELVSFVSMSNVSDNGRLVSLSSVPFSLVKSGFTRFTDGDVLFAKITPCMENGKGALARELTNGIGCGSTEFHVIRCRDDLFAPYLFQILRFKQTRQSAETYMSGSAGQKRVPASFFSKYRFSPPGKAEQRRIAEILSTLDNAIEQSDALISKHYQIRLGLMQDLFARGIQPNGQLRPTPEEEPRQFKTSSLGLIPSAWKVYSVSDLFTRRSERGIAGLPIMAITMSDGLIERSSVERRVESNLRPEGHALVRAGDIAYNMMRMWQGVLGRAEFDCLVSPAYVVMKPGPKIDSLFAEYLFSSDHALKWFKRLSYGVVDDRLRLYARDLLRIQFAIPDSKDEQQAIAERMKKLDNVISNEEVYLEKLRQKKEGLMQDLLTGKVPVGIATEEQLNGKN